MRKTSKNQRTALARRGSASQACAVTLLTLLGAACSSGGDATPVESVHLACRAPGGAEDARRPQPLAGTVRMYLDVSEPIGGFLPFDDRDRSGFKLVVQSLPGHLSEAFSNGRRIDPQWRAVSDGQPTNLDQPRIARGLFGGKESRLDLAIQAMIRDVEGGAEATALITDLVATGPLTGAMGVANALDPAFVRAVQSGRFDLGLFGVRAPYWGVRTRHCKGATAGLGCWFSELKPGYQPLTRPAKIPVYIFLIGRSGGGVEKIGASLQRIAAEQRLEARWEVLSRAAFLPGLDFDCKAALLREDGRVDAGRRQVALVADRSGFRCQRDEKVALGCRGAGSPVNFVGASWVPADAAKSPWREAVRFSGSGGPGAANFSLTIDCDRLPVHKTLPAPPPFQLEIRRLLQQDSWDDWSSESDEREADLGKTLQLKLFVETARFTPSTYRVLCGPLRPGEPGS